MSKKTINALTAMLCLQLFAEVINTTGSEGLSVENKTHYDKTLIREAQPALIHDQFGQERDIPKNGGKSIEFRKFASLPKATKPLTEGVTPDGKALSVTAKVAYVEQYGDYVKLTDMLDMTAIDPVVIEAIKIVGNQAGLTLDTITRDVLHTGTNVSFATKADGTEVLSRSTLDKTAILKVADIRKGATKLKAANAPMIDGGYVAIIHPYASEDLRNDPNWIDVHKYAAPENIFEGEIGKIDKVRFVETTEAKIYKDETCPEGLAVFGTLILGANAYGKTKIDGGGLQTIIKQLGSAGTADALNQRSTVGWKATKTAEILVESYMVRIESCSSYSESAEAN